MKANDRFRKAVYLTDMVPAALEVRAHPHQKGDAQILLITDCRQQETCAGIALSKEEALNLCERIISAVRKLP